MQYYNFIIPAAPPSVNTLWRRNPRGGMYLNKTARAYYDLVARAVGDAKLSETWDAVSVWIFVRPTRKAGDVDNYIKPVLDGLTKAGFWRDDAVVRRVSCILCTVRKGGETCVYVRRELEKYIDAPFNPCN